MFRLDNGDVFPKLTIARTGGGEIHLPDDLSGAYGVVLFNRGSWCPYCNAQLAAFSRTADKLAEAGIKVVSLSVDDEEKSKALVEKHHLNFPVGYSADAEAIAAATGAFVNRGDATFLQATGFVLDRQGRVATAVYSSGAIGRLMPDDVLGLVRYLKTAA